VAEIVDYTIIHQSIAANLAGSLLQSHRQDGGWYDK